MVTTNSIYIKISTAKFYPSPTILHKPCLWCLWHFASLLTHENLNRFEAGKARLLGEGTEWSTVSRLASPFTPGRVLQTVWKYVWLNPPTSLFHTPGGGVRLDRGSIRRLGRCRRKGAARKGTVRKGQQSRRRCKGPNKRGRQGKRRGQGKGKGKWKARLAGN